eukprot:1648484-Amphidinium_carterae.1
MGNTLAVLRSVACAHYRYSYRRSWAPFQSSMVMAVAVTEQTSLEMTSVIIFRAPETPETVYP